MSKRGRRTRAQIGLVLIIWLFAKEFALAAEWSAATTASVGVEYNSNKFLQRSDEGAEVSGLIANLSTQLSRATPTSTFSIRPSLRLSQYPDQERLSNKQGGISSSLIYPLERSNFQVKGSFALESTVASELSTTGLVAIDRQRETMTIAPTYSHEVSPVGSIEISGTATNVAYEDAVFSELYGYDYYTTDLSYRHNVAESTQWNGVLGIGNFRASELGNSTINYSVNLGYSTKFSPNVSAFINVGERVTQSEQNLGPNGKKTTETTWLINTGITQELSRSQRKVTFSRNVEPSGIGALSDQTALSATLTRQFSVDYSGGLDLSVRHLRTLFPGETQTRWQIIRGGLNLNKEYARTWLFSAQYRRHWQHYDTTDENASSHEVLLTISYIGMPNRFSVNKPFASF